MISIWFFIGFSLLINGALILAAGLYDMAHPPAEVTIVLANLHASVWWGGLLFLIGLIYCIQFRPKRA